jgi:hypothetical protein
VSTKITHNQGNGEGGGIENWGALTVSNSDIVGNRIYDLTSGGIDNSGSLAIINSTIAGNANQWGWANDISGNPPRYQ